MGAPLRATDEWRENALGSAIDADRAWDGHTIMPRTSVVHDVRPCPLDLARRL